MYAYLKQKEEVSKENQDKVSLYFNHLKSIFFGIFKGVLKKKRSFLESDEIWKINFLDAQKIDIACSIIQFSKKFTIRIALL